jgi:aminoglycoside 6'-N-acetyltransferase
VIRRYGDGDLTALAAIVAKPQVARWWGEFDRKRLRAAIAAATLAWTIEVDGTPSGLILVDEETEPDERHVEVDVFLDPAHDGQGIGGDALRQALVMMFEGRGHHRAVLYTLPDNARAIHVYEKIGFRSVGVVRKSNRVRGEWIDELMMDLLAEEMT